MKSIIVNYRLRLPLSTHQEFISSILGLDSVNL